MGLPTIADCFRVAINYSNSINAQTATNVIHVLAPAMTEDDVFDALNANVTTAMWEPCTTALNTDQVVITKLDGTPDGRVFGPSSLTGPWRQHFGSADFIPQLCALVKLSTAASGRSGRGRIFLPFVAEEHQGNGVIVDTAASTTTAAWVTFANALVADDLAMAVASYTHSTASQVLDLACERPTATQRKRNKR